MSTIDLRCLSCKKEINLNEEVKLDVLNVLTHKSCKTETSIKDSGTLEEIVNKYPFFESILHPLVD